MPKKPLPKGLAKSKRIALRLTENEFILIQKICEKLNISLSQYLRNKIFTI